MAEKMTLECNFEWWKHQGATVASKETGIAILNSLLMNYWYGFVRLLYIDKGSALIVKDLIVEVCQKNEWHSIFLIKPQVKSNVVDCKSFPVTKNEENAVSQTIVRHKKNKRLSMTYCRIKM